MDTYSRIRADIGRIDTFDLAERSGMFCEFFCEALKKTGADLSGGRYSFSADEPYAAYFFWDFGNVTLDVTVAGDSDESYWKIVGTEGKKRVFRRGNLENSLDTYFNLINDLNCLLEKS